MRDRLPQNLRKLTGAFGSFTPGQKAVTVVAVLALVIGGYFFASWASKPSYSALFNNLSGTDASAIVESLQAAGTPYELTDGGKTIMVPQDQVYDLRIQLSGEGLPGEAETGYALLDKQGVTTSEFMQQVGYQRAMEGELANTIKAIEGVESATVHLVIPKKDVFADNEKQPTASVLVGSQAGKSLSGGQVKAIVHLVASSVEGLAPEQVTIAGADGKILSAGGGAAVASGDGDARAQQTEAFEQRMNTELIKLVESVVGPGHARVATTAELDFDQTETKTQKYTDDPAVRPLSEKSATETYTGTGTGPGAGGVLGPDNIQTPAGNGNGTYQQKEDTKNNPIGSIVENRKSAGGAIKKLNVGVLLDSRTAGVIDPAEVQQLISTAAGVDTARGDNIVVTAMPFDQSAQTDAQKQLAEAALADKQARQETMVKTAAIVLVILIVLFMAWRANRRSKRSRLSAEELAHLEEMQAALEAQRLAALEGAEMAALEAAPPQADLDAEAREARQREIAQMVEQQPDEVAQLLRGWLAERR